MLKEVSIVPAGTLGRTTENTCESVMISFGGSFRAASDRGNPSAVVEMMVTSLSRSSRIVST